MIGAVIAEFNPLHNGHYYVINEMRRQGCDRVVAIMSGDFTQRGQAAIIPKSQRAKAAVLCGADLVIELPVIWALSSAQGFAAGGVRLADALGFVDRLCFGSESGETAPLIKIAQICGTARFNELLRQKLSEGVNYPTAYEASLKELLPDESPLDGGLLPNDTLAIEYIKAIISQSSTIEPMAIKRQGAMHDEQAAADEYSSASFIRNNIQSGNLDLLKSLMPKHSFDALTASIADGSYNLNDRLDRTILFALRTKSQHRLSEIAGVSEGLEGRIYKSLRQAQSLDELYELIKTKRYPLSRIRRICLCAALGIKTDDAKGLPPFIRILAMNNQGAELIKSCNAKLPIIGSYSQYSSLDALGKRVFDLQIKASELYALGCEKIIKNYSETTYKITRI